MDASRTDYTDFDSSSVFICVYPCPIHPVTFHDNRRRRIARRAARKQAITAT
jgi:hypothetical protein